MFSIDFQAYPYSRVYPYLYYFSFNFFIMLVLDSEYVGIYVQLILQDL